MLALVSRAFRRQHLPDVEVAVFGRKMLLKPSDLIGNCLIFTPQWFDPRERRAIKHVLSTGDYAVDVGANIGAYTLLMADLVGPSGGVLAIEAERENAKRLRHNLGINGMGWVDVHDGGVSDKDETLALLLNSTGNAGGHSFHEQSDIADPPVQEVQCRALSDLVDPERTPRLMKLDIEGFEFRVLRKYLDDVPRVRWPEYILTEDYPSRREADAVSLLVDHGYKIIKRFGANVFLSVA